MKLSCFVALCLAGILGESLVAAQGDTVNTTSTTTSSGTSTTVDNGITTPSPIQDGMVSDCDLFHFVTSGETCLTIVAAYGISLTDFYAWNPAAGTSCLSLWANTYCCVGVIGSTPTSASAASAASSGNAVATPSPVQPGITTSCKTFHLVVSGDICSTVASAAGITLADFYSWNPTVGSTCASLWLGYYVCIGV